MISAHEPDGQPFRAELLAEAARAMGYDTKIPIGKAVAERELAPVVDALLSRYVIRHRTSTAPTASIPVGADEELDGVE